MLTTYSSTERQRPGPIGQRRTAQRKKKVGPELISADSRLIANVRPHSGGAFMWVRLREEKTDEMAANTAQAAKTMTASRTRLRTIFGSAWGATRGGTVKSITAEESMRGRERT